LKSPFAHLLTALPLAFAALFGSACVGKLIGLQPPARIGPAGSPVPAVGLIAGSPITAASATLQLPKSPDGSLLTPVGASGNLVLLRSGGGFGLTGPVSYVLWDSSTGGLGPVPGWPADDAAKDRVLGVFDTWAIVSHDQPSPSGSLSVALLNLRTGERRQIGTSGDSSSQGRVVASNGWVAWTDPSPSRSGIWIYDIAAGKDAVIPAMVRRISDLAVGNGVVAWWQAQGFNNGQPQIVLRDSSSNTFQSVPAADVRSLVLASDGQTVVWLQGDGSGGPGIFVHDFKSGTGGRLLGGQSIAVSLSVSGDWVSWQPGPAAGQTTAGLYNVKTHELRVVQTASGAATRFSRVLGPWYLWSTSTRQPAAGALSPCCSLLRLPN
jgi:hypothetical protein